MVDGACRTLNKMTTGVGRQSPVKCVFLAGVMDDDTLYMMSGVGSKAKITKPPVRYETGVFNAPELRVKNGRGGL